MIQSSLSLKDLRQNNALLKRPLFYNLKNEVHFSDLSIAIFLDIDNSDKIQQIGIELGGVSPEIEDYARAFANSLLTQKISEAKYINETTLLKSLSLTDKKELEGLFPLINPFFLCLEGLISIHSGESLGMKALEGDLKDLLCRCEGITKTQFRKELVSNRYLLKDVFKKVNLAASCGSCYQDALSIYKTSIEESYFYQGLSYVEWVLKIDSFLNELSLREENLADYRYEILSFEKLLLKLRIKRGKFHYSRPDLTSLIQKHLHDFMGKEIKLSIIF